MDEELRPLGAREALGLAVPLATGGVLTSAAVLCGGWAIAEVGVALADAVTGRRHVSEPSAVVVLLLSLLAGWLGAGLARLDPLRRRLAITLGALTTAVLAAERLPPGAVLLAAGTTFALATPAVRRWCTPGALAARGVSIGPFVAAVAGLELVLGALAFVTTAFARLIAEVGIPTDRTTDLTIALAALVAHHLAWLAPLSLVAATPLLLLPRRRAGAAIGVVALATVFGLGHALAVPVLAIVRLPDSRKL